MLELVQGSARFHILEGNPLAGIYRDHIAARTKSKWWHAVRDFRHELPVRTVINTHSFKGSRGQPSTIRRECYRSGGFRKGIDLGPIRGSPDPNCGPARSR